MAVRECDSQSVSRRVFASTADVESIMGVKPLNGYWTTMTHLAKGYIGTGIFAMGNGFKNSGLLFGSVFLLMIGVINLNCQHVLIRTANKISEEEGGNVKPSFAETVRYTMELSRIKCLRDHSKKLGTLTNIFLCCCELGFCCVYLVFIAEHLVQIADTHNLLNQKDPLSMHIMLSIILLPLWASTFLTNLKVLLPISFVANGIMFGGIIIIFYYTLRDLPPTSDREMVVHYAKWPLYFGTALFAFEGITFIIPLRNEMATPEEFTSFFGVLNVGMVFVVCLYLLVGLLGYWKYGDDVESSVFLNVAHEDKLVGDIMDGLMAIAVLCTFTLHMYIPFEITFPLFFRKYGPFKHGLLVSYIYRAVPVLITFTMANIIPFLALFISLIGATGGSFLALIMPAMLELVAFQGELSWFHTIKNWLIIAIGVVGSISGSILSISAIVEELRAEYGT